MPDAIVIGAGPNGLVAANVLADAGWSVLVLEANDTPGGAVRSTELIEPGFINDHNSAFYPLGVGSPVMQAMELERYGVTWKRSPLVLAHPSIDGTCPVLSQNLDETSANFESFASGDGDSWRASCRLWNHLSKELLDTLFQPFPPVRYGIKLARKLPPNELLRFARFAVLPVRRMGEEMFKSEPPQRLLAGMALHADLLPESSLGGFYGWLLAMLGQTVGWPVPEGGAGMITKALVARLESKGGVLRCGVKVDKVVVRHGRAVGVVDAAGEKYTAERGVIADVDAPRLFLQLLPDGVLPADVLRDINRFIWDTATVKVDWNLDAPIPWTSPDARRAGTVHVVDSVDRLSITASELARSVIPERPFLLLGQQSMTDPSRAPKGKDTAWAYTHVPTVVKSDNGGSITGSWDDSERNQFVERMESEIEALAPGFRDLIRGRHVVTPHDFQAGNSNLRSGAVGGGTAQLHQQLIFRPIPGLGRPETPVPGLFLASSSAHPGGGVHGACGNNAARAALLSEKHKHFVKAVRWAAKRANKKPSPEVT